MSSKTSRANYFHPISFVLVLTLLTLGFSLLPQLKPGGQSNSLPRQIGAINDYGNVLSMNDREKLSTWVEELAEVGVRITLLISRRDPFSSPDRYASEIRGTWELQKEGGSFLLFLKEEDGWVDRVFLSPLGRRLLGSTAQVEDFKRRIEGMTAEGSIRKAALFSVRRIYQANFGRGEESEGERKQGGLFSLLKKPLFLGLGLGALAFFLLVLLLIREIRLRCPKCGTRMAVEGQGERRIRYCRNCGYSEDF